MGCTGSKGDGAGGVETRRRSSDVFGVTKGSPESKYPYIIVNGAAKKLGSGAYSTVFAATDKVLMQPKHF